MEDKTTKIQELMEKETKRLAKKYFNTDVKVMFVECFSGGKPLRGKCIAPLKTIEYHSGLYKYRDGLDSFPPHAFSTIVHEVCHLKWLHGEPEFKKKMCSILAKERRNKKKFEEEVNKIIHENNY